MPAPQASKVIYLDDESTTSPLPAPEGPLASALRSGLTGIFPAVGTAAGAIGAGVLATPETVGFGTIPAVIAGGAGGGYAAKRAQDYLLGDYAKRNALQIEANQKAHEIASGAGEIVPTLVSMAGGGGVVPKLLGIGERAVAAAGLKAGTAEAEALAAKAVADASAGMGAKAMALRGAEGALGGARLGASHEAQQDDPSIAGFADNIARSAIQFGPLGILPHAETLAKTLGYSIPQAGLAALSGAAYESMVHGKPMDFQKIKDEGLAGIVPFALFNAVSHGVGMARQSSPKETAPLPTTPERDATPTSAPVPESSPINPVVDANLAAGNPKTAEALAGLKTSLEAQNAAAEQQQVAQALQPLAEAKPEIAPSSAPIGSPPPEAPSTAPESRIPIQTSPEAHGAPEALNNQVRQWDVENKGLRADQWFEGGNANPDALQGFNAAAANGGFDLQAHGMSKEATLTGGVRNLLGILENGIDPSRKALDTANLVNPGGQNGGMTGSGAAYNDGPFILVAKPGTRGGIRDSSQIAGILVNEAHGHITDALRERIQEIRPDIEVEPYSKAGELVKRLKEASSEPQNEGVPPEESPLEVGKSYSWGFGKDNEPFIYRGKSDAGQLVFDRPTLGTEARFQDWQGKDFMPSPTEANETIPPADAGQAAPRSEESPAPVQEDGLAQSVEPAPQEPVVSQPTEPMPKRRGRTGPVKKAQEPTPPEIAEPSGNSEYETLKKIRAIGSMTPKEVEAVRAQLQSDPETVAQYAQTLGIKNDSKAIDKIIKSAMRFADNAPLPTEIEKGRKVAEEAAAIRAKQEKPPVESPEPQSAALTQPEAQDAPESVSEARKGILEPNPLQEEHDSVLGELNAAKDAKEAGFGDEETDAEIASLTTRLEALQKKLGITEAKAESPFTEFVRQKNEERLTDNPKAKAKWTPEIYDAVERYSKSGDKEELSQLTPIQRGNVEKMFGEFNGREPEQIKSASTRPPEQRTAVEQGLPKFMSDKGSVHHRQIERAIAENRPVHAAEAKRYGAELPDSYKVDKNGIAHSKTIEPSLGGEPATGEVKQSHVNRALDLLRKSPIGRKLLRSANVVQDWQRVLSHADNKGRAFSASEINTIKASQGFYDPVTGKSFVIRDNILLKPGETSEQAIVRVMMHERVGHDGMGFMRANDPEFEKLYHEVAGQIPKAELDAIAERYGYDPVHDRDRIIGEWFARNVESLKPGELPDPQSVFGRMWQAVKDFINRLTGKQGATDQGVRDLAAAIAHSDMALEPRLGKGEEIEPVYDGKGIRRVDPRNFASLEELHSVMPDTTGLTPEQRREVNARWHMERAKAKNAERSNADRRYVLEEAEREHQESLKSLGGQSPAQIKSKNLLEPSLKDAAGEVWDDTKKAWGGIAKGVSEVAKAGRKFYDTSGQRDHVAATFDAAENMANQAARQAENHVDVAAHDAGFKPSELDTAKKAATFVRQARTDTGGAKGMIARLDEILAKGLERKLGKDGKKVIEMVKTQWNDLRQIAIAAKEENDAAFKAVIDSGGELTYREAYAKGDYLDTKDGSVIFDEKPPTGTPSGSFKKQKVFNDYAEAVLAGREPTDLRLDKLTGSSTHASLRSANKALWENSIGRINMPDGTPAMAPIVDGKVPDGYRAVEIRPGKLMAIHEEMAPLIRALTSPSLVPALISKGAAFIKHNMLVFDLFHGSRFAQLQAAFEKGLPSYRKGLALMEYRDADLASAVKHKLISQESADWAKANRPKIEKLTAAGVNLGKISDALYADVVPLIPGAKLANNFIFQKLSRGIIAQSAVHALEKNAKAHPEWTQEQLHRYTAKEINAYYRNLGSQGIFKSKTFQDMARILMLAPNWIEGMVRSEARGYGQLAKFPKTGKLGNIGSAMATGAVAYFALAQLVNMLTRGKPTWENEEPGHKLDAWIPDSLQGSDGYFINPLSVFAETTHDAIKYTDAGAEPLDVTARIASNKLHPVARALKTLLGGTDFAGRPLHGMDRVTKAMSDAAPIPIFAKGAMDVKGGLERQLLSTAGIKADAAKSPTANVYTMADVYKSDHGLKQNGVFEPSDYKPLRTALEDGDFVQARQEYKKLLTSKKREDIRDYFKNYPKRPFTGSNEAEVKFLHSLDAGQKAIYHQATKEREGIAKRFQRMSG